MKLNFSLTYFALTANIIIAAGILIYVIPLSQRTLNLHKEKNTLDENYKISEQAQQKEIDLLNFYRDAKQKDIIEKSILSESAFLDFIEEIENLGSQKNVKTELSFITAKQITEEKIILLPLDMTIRGDFYDSLNFLANLESRPYYLNPQNFEITAINESGTEIIMSINFKTFWRKNVQKI